MLTFENIQQAKDFHAANPDRWSETYLAIDAARKAGPSARISHRDVQEFFWPMDKPRIQAAIDSWALGTFLQQQKMSFERWLTCPEWVVRKDIETASEIIALAYGYGFDIYNLSNQIRSNVDLTEFYATNRGRITRELYSINQFMIMRCGVGNKTREALSKDEGARSEFREKWVAQNARYKWSWHE